MSFDVRYAGYDIGCIGYSNVKDFLRDPSCLSGVVTTVETCSGDAHLRGVRAMCSSAGHRRCMSGSSAHVPSRAAALVSCKMAGPPPDPNTASHGELTQAGAAPTSGNGDIQCEQQDGLVANQSLPRSNYSPNAQGQYFVLNSTRTVPYPKVVLYILCFSRSLILPVAARGQSYVTPPLTTQRSSYGQVLCTLLEGISTPVVAYTLQIVPIW